MSQCNSVEGVAEHFGIGTERYQVTDLQRSQARSQGTHWTWVKKNLQAQIKHIHYEPRVHASKGLSNAHKHRYRITEKKYTEISTSESLIARQRSAIDHRRPLFWKSLEVPSAVKIWAPHSIDFFWVGLLSF